jgi:hypothetical protein
MRRCRLVASPRKGRKIPGRRFECFEASRLEIVRGQVRNGISVLIGDGGAYNDNVHWNSENGLVLRRIFFFSLFAFGKQRKSTAKQKQQSQGHYEAKNTAFGMWHFPILP